MDELEKFDRKKKYRWVRLKYKQDKFWKSIIGTNVKFKAEYGVSGFPIFCGKIISYTKTNSSTILIKTGSIKGDLGTKGKLEEMNFFSNSIRWMKKMTDEEAIMFNLLYGSIHKGD